MSEHAKLVRANREYRCPAEWFHDPTIYPGETYVRVTMFPHPLDSGKRFGNMAAYHRDCYDERISDE